MEITQHLEVIIMLNQTNKIFKILLKIQINAVKHRIHYLMEIKM